MLLRGHTKTSSKPPQPVNVSPLSGDQSEPKFYTPDMDAEGGKSPTNGDSECSGRAVSSRTDVKKRTSDGHSVCDHLGLVRGCG